MKKLLLRHPYLLCGLGQIRHEKKVSGWVLAVAFWDCFLIGGYFLFLIDHRLGLPIGLLCELLAGLLWLYSYLDYLDLRSRKNETTLFTEESKYDFYESGRIAYLRGELEDARKDFQSAIKYNREDYDSVYQLACVNFDMGNKRKAKQLFEKYAAAGDSRKWGRETDEYLKKIKNSKN